DPDRRMHLAILALLRGDDREARRQLAHVENLTMPELGPAAAILIRLGLRPDAEKVYRELSKRLAAQRPAPLPAWTMDKQIVDGILAVTDNRDRESLSVLEARLPLRPFNSPIAMLAWEVLADTYAARGWNDDARRVLQAANREDVPPNSATAALAMRLRLRLATLERQAGRTDDADRIVASLRKQLAFADRDH